jgi:nitrogen fixation/metabolism regulation signal transduction histidine kinase
VDTTLQQEYARAGEMFTTYQALFKAPPNYLKNRFVAVYIGILGAAVVICMVGGIYLARRLVRRIHELSAATAQVAEGDLSVRVDPGTEDEVGHLVASFNRMVSELSDNRARIEYLQKISAWQEMARRLAHEIKNPLTPIQLAAQQVKEKYAGDDPAFQALLDQSSEIISEEVATLRRLTSDFAAFAKLPEVSPESVELSEFLEECKTALMPVAEQAGVSVTFEDQTGGVKVSIDRIMMKRVMDNLVRNASEALGGLGIEDPKITVRAQKRKSKKKLEVEIRIRDNGPGILPEHHPSIFDPYFTTKSEGTGLGLAISKKIVLEHDGRIWLDDKISSGAAFIVVLPAWS